LWPLKVATTESGNGMIIVLVIFLEQKRSRLPPLYAFSIGTNEPETFRLDTVKIIQNTGTYIPVCICSCQRSSGGPGAPPHVPRLRLRASERIAAQVAASEALGTCLEDLAPARNPAGPTFLGLFRPAAGRSRNRWNSDAPMRFDRRGDLTSVLTIDSSTGSDM
jgi:hypothetical protein